MTVGMVAALLLTGCAPPQSRPAVQPATQLQVPAEYSTPSTTVPPVPTAVAAGTPVTDGSMQFVVRDIGQSPKITTQYNVFTPTGVFMVVSLTATNVGTTPLTFMAINQKLIVSGKQYTYADLLTFTLNSNATSTINPGLSIDTDVAFDVPAGSRPQKIELHEDPASYGVYSLVGT